MSATAQEHEQDAQFFGVRHLRERAIDLGDRGRAEHLERVAIAGAG